MTKKWAENYKKLVLFLGEALGENYEVVLHIIDNNDSYIGKIINSHVSGRSKGAPLTNLALQKIKDEDYKRNDSILNYKVLVKNGKDISGSTFYIKDQQENLLGLLCINADFSKHKRAINDLLSLTNMNIESLLDSECEEYKDNSPVEMLSINIEEIINDTIDPVLLDERVSLSKEIRLNILEDLESKGIFQLKGAISQVAKTLNISEPTLYRNLKEVKK